MYNLTSFCRKKILFGIWNIVIKIIINCNISSDGPLLDERSRGTYWRRVSYFPVWARRSIAGLFLYTKSYYFTQQLKTTHNQNIAEMQMYTLLIWEIWFCRKNRKKMNEGVHKVPIVFLIEEFKYNI